MEAPDIVRHHGVNEDGQDTLGVTIHAPMALAVPMALSMGGLGRAHDERDLRPAEMMSVQDAEQAANALGDAQALHSCPLCENTMRGIEFVNHAAQCIQTRAPRRKFWTPPGFSDNAIIRFPERRGGI